MYRNALLSMQSKPVQLDIDGCVMNVFGFSAQEWFVDNICQCFDSYSTLNFQQDWHINCNGSNFDADGVISWKPPVHKIRIAPKTWATNSTSCTWWMNLASQLSAYIAMLGWDLQGVAAVHCCKITLMFGWLLVWFTLFTGIIMV